jgi:translation initiation factor 1
MSKSKKLSSLEDLGGFVYSTNENFKPEEESEAVNLSPSDQQLEAHFEKKGRGGKTVVIIKGFEGPEEDLKDLSKKLKSHCGVGGSTKNGEILIQGNVRDKAIDFLKKAGYSVKRVGG